MRNNGNSTPPRQHSRGLTREAAFAYFDMFVNMNYSCSIKYARGFYYVEVPVRLRGDNAYGKEGEILALAMRGGNVAVQTGQTIRIG